jgi:hypothetical protein
MKNQYFLLAIALMTFTTFTNCKRQQIPETVKMLPNDPFKSTMIQSQYFDIKAHQDTVIEGLKGTLIIMPKGCLKNENGDIVTDNVKIELAESLSKEDILLSNLNTTSNGKPLETDGMLYFNATANGKQLTINKDNPIHIEMPTSKKKPDMQVYKGTRDEKGNMNWVEPQEINRFLTIVDLKSLDFLPEGFQREVEQNMPYKNHKIATQDLVDSLYFSFSNNSAYIRLLRRKRDFDYNEPYYNKNKKVENGKYTSDSYAVEHDSHDSVRSDSSTKRENCGIDPAIIKVLKSEKYQNTLIATREFEARLKLIFRTCKNSVLEIYIKNLDKNLYELDALASKICGGGLELPDYKGEFEKFAQQRLTKVRNADKYAELLRGYYENQLAKVKTELEQNQEKLRKSLEKQDKETEKIVESYKKLLFKRETYRMETYGFEWTETGWLNVDNGTIPKTWDVQPLEVAVSNGKNFDRVYTYVIYESIKSLYRLNSYNNEQFYVGNNDDKKMIMPKHENAVVITIGYKGEVPSLAVQEFETGTTPKMSVSLSLSSAEKVKEAINRYEKYSKENQISEDLIYMAIFYQAQQKQKAIEKENNLMSWLLNYVEPCCAKLRSQ